MSGFLDYIDDLEERNEVESPQQLKRVVESTVSKQPKKKSKVLCLNVEVRSAEGAQLVIEKIQDWVAKQNGSVPNKKQFRIPPKKIVKSSTTVVEKPIVEAVSHAINILDGLPDTPPENQIPMAEGSINTMMPQTQKINLDSVAGHASALL